MIDHSKQNLIDNIKHAINQFDNRAYMSILDRNKALINVLEYFLIESKKRQVEECDFQKSNYVEE